MNGLESWILSYLLNSLWQLPLLLAAGWVAAVAVSKAGAAWEHRVWVSVLLMQSLLPALSTLPWDEVRAWLAQSSAARRAGEAHVSVVVGAGSAYGGWNLPQWMLAAMAIAYGAIFAYFAARFLWRWRRLSVLRREAVPVVLRGDAAVAWRQCAARYGVENATLAASTQIFGPVTLGVARKLVLLPAAMFAELHEADLVTVITHEFAHMRRNDFAKNLLYELLSLPVSYHPLLPVTRERILESREVVCDAMAAGHAGRHEYARSLLRLASLLVKGMPARTPHAIGIFDANAFERRLMRLTGNTKQLRGPGRLAVLAACAALGLGVCGSALALSMHVDAAAAANSGHDTDPPKAAEPMNVSAGVIAGNKLNGPVPKYPVDAKKARIQGKVVLDAVIGKDGTVEKLEVLSGPKELQQSSLDAVRQWTYKPFLLNGDPVEVRTTITVIYSLEN
jgi:TonB family protein